MVRPDPTSIVAETFQSLMEVGSMLRRFPERIAARHRATRVCVPKDMEPRINYGRTVFSSSKRPIGGEIKLIHLRNDFPECLNEFNLIYLVSSALPPQVEELVRVAKKKGAKLVWNQNGIAYPGCYGDSYPWINRRMARLIALADYVVYQSEFCKAASERYLGAVSSPCEILFNPVDAEVFSPRTDPLPGGIWELLCAGTSHAFYRISAPLEALRRLLDAGHSVRLTIAGEFRWKGGRDEVLRRIESLGLGGFVRLLPPFSQEEAPAIYRGAHLLIHAKDKDPCPTVPIEAMACGLPVIAPASGGMPELVPSSCGRLLEVPSTWASDSAPSPDAVAAAVVEVMGALGSFSRAARDHASASLQRSCWVERHGQIFREVLAA